MTTPRGFRLDYDQTVKLFEEGLDLETVLDVAIDLQGLVGVGLISYGDAIQQYVQKHVSHRKTAKPSNSDQTTD
jgi:hypothetical protein